MMLFVIAVPCQVPSDIYLPVVGLVSHNYRLCSLQNSAVNEVELGFFFFTLAHTTTLAAEMFGVGDF